MTAESDDYFAVPPHRTVNELSIESPSQVWIVDLAQSIRNGPIGVPATKEAEGRMKWLRGGKKPPSPSTTFFESHENTNGGTTRAGRPV